MPRPQCELCPHPPTFDDLLPVVDWMPGEPAPPRDKRKWAHRTCALFLPEVTVMEVPDFDRVQTVEPPSALDALVCAAVMVQEEGKEGGEAGREGGKAVVEEAEMLVAVAGKPTTAVASAPAPIAAPPVVSPCEPQLQPALASPPTAQPDAADPVNTPPEEPLIEIAFGVSQIPRDRFRLKCYLCKQLHPTLRQRGAPIQCAKGKCTRAVHVSCAKLAGLFLETYWDTVQLLDGDTVVVEDIERGRVFCNLHDPRRGEEKKRAQVEAEMALADKLGRGTAVWCH